MKRLMWVLLGLIFPFLLCAETLEPKRKILILCSNGGNGHNAAAGALKSLLQNEYDFKVVYPIDRMHFLGVKSGEGFYNLALRNRWTRSVNVVSRYVAPKLFRTHKKKLESIITRYIQHEKPSLVISLIPFINYSASEAARKLSIPYLLITTDHDLHTWVHGLQGVSHPHFKVVVGADLWCSRELLQKRNIPPTSIETIGLPLRPDFLIKRDRLALKAEYQIPKERPVILIMIGGQGGEAALDYAKTLGRIQLGVHLIVCAGKNKDLAASLREVRLHPTNSMTVMEFTDKIPELMTISDLIISKPGTISITEAMAMHLPIIVDGTSPILTWEQANIDMILHHSIGGLVTRFEDVEPLVRELLFDSELRQQIELAYRKIPPNRFNEAIPSLISEMCSH